MFYKKIYTLSAIIFLSTINFELYSTDKIIKLESEADQSFINWIAKAKASIQKKVLANGLTILFYPITHSPEVSIKAVVDFGARDEQPGQYGFAHMIEHMIFKGTKLISEVDIDRIADKFGGTYRNAFTSYDKTVFEFLTDNKNWPVFMGILADCMQNAEFDEDHFNSEVKAVESEMGLRRNATFPVVAAACLPYNHPYVHPVLGRLEDLSNASAADLKKFYQENYTPEKTTLVVVGNIEQTELFAEVDALFGSIPARQDSKKECIVRMNLWHEILFREI